VKFTTVTAKRISLGSYIPCISPQVYPARPVEPGSPREIYICNSRAYFTGVPSGCSTGVKFTLVTAQRI